MLKTIDQAQYDLLKNENISVYDSTDREIYTNNDTIYFPTSKELFENIRDKKEIRYTEGPYKIIAFCLPEHNDKIIVTAGAIDVQGEALLRQMRYILILTMVGSVLVTMVLGWFFVGGSLRPMSSIIQQVSTLSPVENSERLPAISENDEIAALVKTFNDLFDKLEESFNLQKNFVANVSHELNNPLTKIKSQLEVGLMQNRQNDAYREVMQSVLEDVNELIELIQGLLQFSRVSAQPFLASTPVRVDELLFDVRDQVLSNFPAYSVILNLTGLPQNESDLVFKMNKQLVTTALKNVIENACKYSPDSQANVNMSVNGKKIVLSINDKGPGIPPEDLPHIFELFYRSSSMESVKGYGIGLALAQRILQTHGFGINVSSEQGKGTTFIITFSN
jgi:signal transduction histidine kinase